MLRKLTRLALHSSVVSVIALGAAAACSSDEGAGSGVNGGNGNQSGAAGDAGASGSNPGGASGASGTSGASGAAGAGVGGAAGGIDIDGAGGSGPRGDGGPEVCDGADNDGDGIIDDVDVGGDGVCDCLNIATLGHIGPWSNGGNIFTTWLNARSSTGAVALDDQVLTADLIRPFQVIVALHVDTTTLENNGVTTPAHHAFSQEEADAVKAWVEAGGGFLTTIGYTGNEALEVVNVNKLLNPLGMGYSAMKLDLSGHVERWDPHPITQDVRRIRIDNGVEPEGSGTTIAWGPGDRVALQVREVGTGHVAVWGDEWITYDSEWQNITDQQVEQLWLNMLKWLSPTNKCQVPIPPPQ